MLDDAKPTPKPVVPLGAAQFPALSDAPTASYAFVLVPDFTLLAFSSAIDPFRIANQLAQRPLYAWTVLSPDGEAVRSSCGVSVNADGPLTSLPKETTLFVCSGNLAGRDSGAPVVDFVKRHHRHGGQVGGICTGAVFLARAGLLAGRTFTLHWENQPGFAERFPDLRPTAGRFEIDDRVTTCGGGAAATDMALHVIARDHGEAFAAVVSDMCLRRASVGSEGVQRTPLGVVLQSRDPWLIAIVQIMQRHVEDPLSMEELARRVGYTRRHIERLFRRSLGQSPMDFYRNLRLDHGRSLRAETEMTLSEIATACGFGTSSRFTDRFRRRFGCTPSRFHHQRRPVAGGGAGRGCAEGIGGLLGVTLASEGMSRRNCRRVGVGYKRKRRPEGRRLSA